MRKTYTERRSAQETRKGIIDTFLIAVLMIAPCALAIAFGA